VLGDGRLSLAEEPSGSLDLLMLDAFSSDAVPAHLLTREAMQEYRAALRPEGLMVFQLTNRHFDLAPAVASTARSLGLDALTRDHTPSVAERERLAAQPSRWLVVGDTEELRAFRDLGWRNPSDGPILSDDYSDLLRMVRWR
jgi:spermidine synthase